MLSLVQVAVEETLEIGPSGRAYLEEAGCSISADVAYYVPNRLAPRLETDATPETSPDP
ncbi:MAG: hypothetical protein AAGE80_13290 [Pseudomonadota bacterium]